MKGLDAIVIESPRSGNTLLSVSDAETHRVLGVVMLKHSRWVASATKRKYVSAGGGAERDEVYVSEGFVDPYDAALWLAERADLIGY